MRAAVIVDGKVDNVIEVDALDVLEGVHLVEAAHAAIGDQWDGAAFVRPPAPAALLSVADYIAAVQAMLDAKPRERRYDGILSACTYATSTVPRFKAEGQACVEWRDAVWARCYQLMADVEAGKMAPPTVDELLSMLPDLVWPE